MIANIKDFSTDVQKEMKKVSWPTKEQLTESTIVVLVTCFVITLFTFSVDWIMSSLMSFVF